MSKLPSQIKMWNSYSFFISWNDSLRSKSTISFKDNNREILINEFYSTSINHLSLLFISIVCGQNFLLIINNSITNINLYEFSFEKSIAAEEEKKFYQYNENEVVYVSYIRNQLSIKSIIKSDIVLVIILSNKWKKY